MKDANKGGITRREFARRAAGVSAVALVPRSGLPAPAGDALSPQIPASAPELSPSSQVEADARYQIILSLYGSRFSDAQKTDLHRLCFEAQPPLDRVRAYQIKNSDAPALYLKPLVEREKKPSPAATPRSATDSAKKS